MAVIRDYNKLASDILREAGGENNISSFTRCATRLRLVLNETPAEAKNRIQNLPGVIAVVESGGQFQVVIGTHVAEVYNALSALLGENHAGATAKPKTRWLDAVIGTMSAVFAPIVYILAAAGILQGLLIVAGLIDAEVKTSGTFAILNFMSWTPFAFLPVFIAITAARHFKCNPYIAVLCCCALINPEWSAMAGRIAGGETITFLFIPLAKTVYTSSVLPPLFLVWALSWLEKRVERILPDVVSALFTPLVCFVIIVPLTLIIIGPVTTWAAMGIASGYNALFAAAPAVAAAVIGGVWQIVVIFGVHWGITPVIMANFDTQGYDSFQAYQTIAVIGQMAAVFGVFLKTRNRELKTTSLSAGVTAIFGITEPAIYGVTLRFKKPFICGCIGGAVGAVVASLFGSLYYAYAALPGLFTLVNAISPDAPMSFIGELAGSATAIVLTIVLVQFVGFEDPVAEEHLSEPETAPVAAATSAATTATASLQIMSPLHGEVIALEMVADDAFAQKALGDGIAIRPQSGQVVAPCDARVETLIDSHHAVGLSCDNGAELLIHVGLNTVNLQGQHFRPLVKEGDVVKAGTPLLEFDKEAIERAGYDLTTPVLVINSDDYRLTKHQSEGDIRQNAPLMTVS
ncbi:beta-glucoside-specific PTS transporter subunit IIABC [Enterobacter kobei]|uniref:PTS beta-glucoside transporter subunit EIIBCA n=2 Tax=Enterobacter kobei TaxID=208224 RepID=A0AA86ITJ9_9ENTR|nr:beta-glucoside-specific PTS transporter subunit IIABC [Enterobacter kobei]OLR21003.1 PTS beta-glucoside transporter subunit EIIBCA [Enterobacter kobei]BCU55661.1 PTS beta-glucoside transporter subunit EIIBCA [Enterobacter kobei]SIQ77772.1 PTS system beta-glucoside-specific IIA component, Glc family /PTS system beta-glucoside-specific IIB component, Glc family /PTS system beta-glucoside-specific IIC component, Glc family [Enterobacter kobei]